jgi:hypothetical protein
MCTVCYNNWHVISKFQYAFSNCVHSMQQRPLPRVYAVCFLQHGIVKLHNQCNVQWFWSCDYWYSFVYCGTLTEGFPCFSLSCYVNAMSGRQSEKPCCVTAQHSSVMYCTSNPMYNYYTSARKFAVQINGYMSQVTLMLSTDINITETTYSCQFQYEFDNQ